MAEKKKIVCRVCGKLFVPCSHCQSTTDEFKWRNFACSLECAKKYVADTIAYRNTLNNKNKVKAKKEEVEVTDIKAVEPKTVATDSIKSDVKTEVKSYVKSDIKNDKVDTTNAVSKEKVANLNTNLGLNVFDDKDKSKGTTKKETFKEFKTV